MAGDLLLVRREGSRHVRPGKAPASPARRSRSRGGSPRSPTPSTRSPPTASTAAPGRSRRRSRSSRPSAAVTWTRGSSTRSWPRSTRPSRSARAHPSPPEEQPAPLPRGQADHAAGRRRDAGDLPQPAAPLGRRGADPERPHRGRAPPLLARRRPAPRGREAACARRSARSSRPRRRSRPGREPRAHGRQLAAAAAAAIYREGPPGWFASDGAADHLLDWIDRPRRQLRERHLRARAAVPRRR